MQSFHERIIGFHCGAAPRGTPPVASGDSPLSEGAGSLLKPPPSERGVARSAGGSIANRPPKVIFDNGRVLQATHINGYLMDATHFHFGVLMSGVHNAWVRAVCGRLKSDYGYSIKIVYNNFPWTECLAAKDAKGAKEDGNDSLRFLKMKFPDPCP